jgi:hypothetical protein
MCDCPDDQIGGSLSPKYALEFALAARAGKRDSRRPFRPGIAMAKTALALAVAEKVPRP